MEKNNNLLIGAIIISIALIICASILKDAYVNKGIPSQSSPYINLDITGLKEALSDRDTLIGHDVAVYLGIDYDDLKQMLYQDKLKDIPYIRIKGEFIFSKKALDEWLYNAAKSGYEAD